MVLPLFGVSLPFDIKLLWKHPDTLYTLPRRQRLPVTDLHVWFLPGKHNNRSHLTD